MALFSRPACGRWAAAIGTAVVALTAPSPGIAASREPDRTRQVVGQPTFCAEHLGSGYSEPISELELSGGDSLLVPWVKKGWALMWLSRDGRQLRVVGADPTGGVVHGLVRLAGNRALVTAEDGLFLFGGGLTVRRLIHCDQTGVAQLVRSMTGGVLAFSDGSLLVKAERGLMRLTTRGRIEQIAKPPPDADEIRILPNDALLVSGRYGHYLVTPDGRTEVIATGTRTRTHVMTPAVTKEMRSEVAHSFFGSSPPPISGAVVVDASGRTRWTVLPDDVVSLSYPIELQDGRALFLTNRGLMRLRRDGSLLRISTAVRMACGDSWGREPWTRSLADGRTVVQSNGVLFAIDAMDHVVPILRPERCDREPKPDDVAATPDGSIYLIHRNRLLRADRSGRSSDVTLPHGAGKLYSVEAYGADLLLETSSDVFHLRGKARLARLVQGDHQLQILYNTDLDGRPLICVDRNSLHRLDGEGKLQRLRNVTAERCWGISSVGSVGLLMRRDDESYVFITRDDRVIDISSPRAWPLTQLEDGSAVLTTMPRGRDTFPSGFDDDEQAALGTTMVRLWPDSRMEEIRLEGGDLESKEPGDPLWPERRRIHSLHFSSPTNGWGVFGGRRILSATSNAGATWRGVRSGGETVQGVSASHFTVDGRNGIAVGGGVIWRTFDSGANWSRSPLPTGIRDMSEVRLVEPAGAMAYAIADILLGRDRVTQLIVSRDGGVTWTPVRLLSVDAYRWGERSQPDEAVQAGFERLSHLRFDLSGRSGFVIGDSRVMTTEDGGDSWRLFSDLRDYSLLEHSRQRLEASAFVHLGDLVIERLRSMPVAITPRLSAERWCVARGKLFCIQRGTESGRPEVTQVELPPDALIVAMAVASDGKHAWAVGTVGTILITEDGGRTWSTHSRDARTVLVGIHFLPDSLHGWIWGDAGLLLTRDGGRTWIAAEAGSTSD